MPIGDNSFLWHVRAGTYQLDMGQVLTTDPFSFTKLGAPWRTQSWLAELGYGWLERVTGGIGWVPVMKFVAIALTIGLLGLVVHRANRGRSWATVGAMVLLTWQASSFAVARPALLGFVLLALVIAMMNSPRRALWLLPAVFWLWASIHATFVIGLGYVFLDTIRRRSPRQLIAVVISGLATALTAHGLGTWWILLKFLENRPALSLISEWQAPDFSSVLVIPFLIVIVGLLVAGAHRRLRPDDLWLVVPFLIFGLLASRNIWPAVMVLTPIAIRFDTPAPTVTRQAGAESTVINWAIACVLVLLGLAGLARGAPLTPERFPAAAAIDSLEPGPQYNDSAVGGYLIYAVWPDRLVYTDDRAELYGEEAIRRFQDIKLGIGVEEEFARYGIRQVIVQSDWQLVDYLKAHSWEIRYEDEYFIVIADPGLT